MKIIQNSNYGIWESNLINPDKMLLCASNTTDCSNANACGCDSQCVCDNNCGCDSQCNCDTNCGLDGEDGTLTCTGAVSH